MIERPFYAALTVLLSVGGLAACSSFNTASEKLANAVTPYQIEVVQGNFVSKEQVEALQPGMPREQVRNILGSPLVTSLFHADRWDYVFTIKRKGLEIESKRLTVYFSGFVLERVEGDEMPSETEFVAQLASQNSKPKIPRLEAKPEELERFAPKESDEEGQAGSGNEKKPEPQPAASYPPLER